MDFTKEQIEQIRNTKSVDELKELAKTNGIEGTDEQIEVIFATFHSDKDTKLTDDELNNVVGGSYCKGGQSFSSGLQIEHRRANFLIVTLYYGKNCKSYTAGSLEPYAKHTCEYCANRWQYYDKVAILNYCKAIYDGEVVWVD